MRKILVATGTLGALLLIAAAMLLGVSTPSEAQSLRDSTTSAQSTSGVGMTIDVQIAPTDGAAASGGVDATGSTTPPVADRNSGGLAFTGFAAIEAIMVALLLLAGGSWLVFIARRRRAEHLG